MEKQVKETVDNFNTENMRTSEQRTREYLEIYYSRDIVDTAIEAAKKELERHKEHEHDTFSVMLNTVLKHHPEAAEVIEEVKDIYEFDKIGNDACTLSSYASLYAHAIKHVIDNPGLKVKSEPKTDYVKNKDFAFVMYFHDNDFGGYMESVAKKFADEYNGLLFNIDMYSQHSQNMVDSYIEDLERMENEDLIKELLKRVFAGVYMAEACDRVTVLNKGTQLSSYTEYAKKVEGYVDYLFNDAEWWFGKFEDVEKECVKHFSSWQHNPTDKLSECWCNGEVLIVKVVNGEMVYEVR